MADPIWANPTNADIRNVHRSILVEYVRGGQPRAYADHENITRVHFVIHNRYSGISHADSRDANDQWAVEEIAHQVKVALLLTGADRFADDNGKPLRTYGDWTNPSWLVHAKHVAPGVVEVFTKSLFFD